MFSSDRSSPISDVCPAISEICGALLWLSMNTTISRQVTEYVNTLAFHCCSFPPCSRDAPELTLQVLFFLWGLRTTLRLGTTQNVSCRHRGRRSRRAFDFGGGIQSLPGPTHTPRPICALLDSQGGEAAADAVGFHDAGMQITHVAILDAAGT